MNIKSIILLLSLLAPLSHAGEISDCRDGQTCLIAEDAYTGPVRLFCLTAPTLQAPWGIQARDALRQHIHGTIRVLMDSLDGDGTPIAELIREDGWNLGLEQVRAGLAKVAQDRCDEPSYLLAEAEAQRAALGVWSAPYTCPGPRYCKHVRSCEEAQFYLRHCKRLEFDRDADDIPAKTSVETQNEMPYRPAVLDPIQPVGSGRHPGGPRRRPGRWRHGDRTRRAAGPA